MAKTGRLIISGIIDTDMVEAFTSQLEALKASGVKQLELYINSPGGDFSGGQEMKELLDEFDGVVNIKIGAICASAATFPLCTVKRGKVSARKTSMIMIHEPYSPVGGDEGELQNKLDTIRKIKPTMLEAYASVSGKSVSDIDAMLAKEEVYMTAEEAKKFGFVTSIENIKAEALPADFLNYIKSQGSPFKALLNQVENSNTDMNKLVIMAMALATANTKLKPSTMSEEDVAAEIQSQANELVGLRGEVSELQGFKAKYNDMLAKEQAAEKAAIKAEIAQAFTDNKITKEQVKHYEDLAESNADAVRSILAAAKPYQPASTRRPESVEDGEFKMQGRESWNYDKWATEDPDGLGKMKASAPEQFQALLNAKIGKRG